MEEGCVSRPAYFLREDWRWQAGSVIVPKTVQYVCTSAFSSKEAFVIRNPLLCEFPKLNPFIMATQQEEEEEKREAQNEPQREPSWPSQMNIYIYISCSSSEREFLSPTESLNFGKYEGWIDRWMDRMLLKTL